MLDAAGGTPPDAALRLSAAYVALSPVSRILDALSLLSISQQIALVVTLILITLICSLIRRNVHSRPIRRAGLSMLTVVVVMALLLGAAIVLPRPMASLSVSNPNLLRIDFHSHTNSSHDARRSFTVERNRKWHSDGGFDAAYVTDHGGFTKGASTFAAALAGERANPQLAGGGTVLISAVEVRYRLLFVLVLGMTAADFQLIDEQRHLTEGRLVSGRVPVSIAALPSPLFDLQRDAIEHPPHVVGIELVDGAPRGLGQLDREESEIRRKSSTLGLALVAGSNNHGWGRTVTAWSLLDLANWRSLRTDSLGVTVERTLQSRGASAVRVIERVRPRTFGASLPLTLPILSTQTLLTLTPVERIIWIVWIWVFAFLVTVGRRRQLAHKEH